ncbi:hypothetical protein HELRODRAFT_63303 [Helobdella robusta]|uniref:non-specific serine/threonine protein kinase n=1 Tax=Helobdella robusta TaxID=6412 RepID=T1FXD8_HELRO|nr:hypothetical protein HELRODRAFT_63303 [Helobdella robusta]ESO12871.1 hypothetical protein HELRODRAFT_63303 [Helobdella robusta]
MKKKRSDFKFGKLIGEGSFSSVYLTKEISTGSEFAIKVLEKVHILREKKQKYVMREKEALLKIDHPFFIKLHFTFQDEDRLYFGLNYARNGELLDHIKRLGNFDLSTSRYYTAEIVLALEYLHSINIIHRDLKPENILLNDGMHIQITDFGSARILTAEDLDENFNNLQLNSNEQRTRRHSFVGTAQYVSPEVLNSNISCFSSDLWALGCMLFQFLTGNHAFSGNHEYQIFQKVIKLEYKIPDEFDESARDLVEKLLVLDRSKRLGCREMGGYSVLKSHKFFGDLEWNNLINAVPPLHPPDNKNK